jgi:hypothetical protein
MVSRGSHKGLSRYAHEIKFIAQSTLCQGQTTSSARDRFGFVSAKPMIRLIIECSSSEGKISRCQILAERHLTRAVWVVGRPSH